MKAFLRGRMHYSDVAAHTKTLFRARQDECKALSVIWQVQTASVPLMEMLVTGKAKDSSQTEIPEENCWDLGGYGVSPALNAVLFQNQSAHHSYIIQHGSLHCFSYCSQTHHLLPAHLVELYVLLEFPVSFTGM